MMGFLQMAVEMQKDIRQLNAPATSPKVITKKNKIIPSRQFLNHHLDEFHHLFVIYNQGMDSQHTSWQKTPKSLPFAFNSIHKSSSEKDWVEHWNPQVEEFSRTHLPAYIENYKGSLLQSEKSKTSAFFLPVPMGNSKISQNGNSLNPTNYHKRSRASLQPPAPLKKEPIFQVFLLGFLAYH